MTETQTLDETLLILPCSGKKSPFDGIRKTGSRIAEHLPNDLAVRLEEARKKVCERARIDETTLVPAWQRYDGHLYTAAGNALCRSVKKGLHVLILSGGYGVLLADEPVGYYDAVFNPDWWPNNVLEESIAAYAKHFRLKRALALVSATTSYRKLMQRVDWSGSGVCSAVLLMPKGTGGGGGAMVKVPRAQGEAFAALLNGNLKRDWRSSDGLGLRIKEFC